ncbi:MAG: hypothetical protein COB12_04460 [Flavobacterium sp.]|nr:MAG: hypothetical protein COB12_04460 [Flavobacterium sp.]
MLKNILNLKGAQQLSKEEQSSINGGGIRPCGSDPFLYIPIDPPNNNQEYCENLPANTVWVSGKCYYCS